MTFASVLWVFVIFSKYHLSLHIKLLWVGFFSCIVVFLYVVVTTVGNGFFYQGFGDDTIAKVVRVALVAYSTKKRANKVAREALEVAQIKMKKKADWVVADGNVQAHCEIILSI